MDLFVYGTLQAPELMAAVMGRADAVGIPARLADHAVYPVAGDVVPLIKAQAAAQTTGLLFENLTSDELKRLDLYEGAFGYVLQPVTVQTSDGPRSTQVYMPPDDIQTDGGAWSLEAWKNNHLAPALHAAHEIFSYGPLPTYAALRRMWPMIEKRAWARHRAAAEASPAALRHDAMPDDFAIHASQPPVGQFFRFDQFEVSHRQFDGTTSDRLNREVFVGTDAVMILPYDAARDRILLVEQLRMGPVVRGDRNPWSLEPVAGMIDARETPLEAGLREAVEEAGLTFSATEHMLSFYPTPGGATDYFTCYLGLCDLPETDAYTGGLATESEDLRLHTLAFDDARALVASGEINAGPLITMLYWLDRERPRLRATA